MTVTATIPVVLPVLRRLLQAIPLYPNGHKIKPVCAQNSHTVQLKLKAVRKAHTMYSIKHIGDNRGYLCFAPDCGKACLFFCSGCKEAQYCSKGCQDIDWGSTFGHGHHRCGRRYKHLKGGEMRAIVESSRSSPLIRCNWLRGSRPPKGKRDFYCSRSCHKVEVDSLVTTMVSDHPRGCLNNYNWWRVISLCSSYRYGRMVGPFLYSSLVKLLE
jgi:hypothetical protein